MGGQAVHIIRGTPEHLPATSAQSSHEATEIHNENFTSHIKCIETHTHTDANKAHVVTHSGGFEECKSLLLLCQRLINEI